MGLQSSPTGPVSLRWQRHRVGNGRGTNAKTRKSSPNLDEQRSWLTIIKRNRQPRPLWLDGTIRCPEWDTRRNHVRIPLRITPARLAALDAPPLPWSVDDYLRAHEWCSACSVQCIRYYNKTCRTNAVFKACMRIIGMNPDHASYIWNIIRWKPRARPQSDGPLEEKHVDEGIVAAQPLDEVVPIPA